MSIIEKSQIVVQSLKNQDRKEVKQTVSIDTKEGSITIVHDTSEITMSLYNYQKLIWLVSEMTR